MRRLICIATAIILVFCAAQAEEAFGTWKDDLYYHANLNCGGADGMLPITEEAAKAAGKYPCPVCVQDNTEWAEGIAAVARGNTIIVRMADDWLETFELTDVFAFVSVDAWPVSEAPARLTEYLHGDRYNRFLKEIRTGDASAIAYVPVVFKLDENGQPVLVMNRRHIGNAWYIVFRPEVPIGDHWNVSWRANCMEIEAKNEELTVEFAKQTVEGEYPIATPQFTDSAAFSRQYDGCRIDVFAEAGADVRANAAVITLFDADADLLEDCALRIGGRVRIPINGYMNGADGIFCCTLTQAEYAYLAGGAKASVEVPSPLDNAGFDGSKYAAVRKGTAGVGIIDADGTFVVPPVYRLIFKPHTDSYPTTASLPFFCTAEDEGLTVLDGDTLDVIAEYVATHNYLLPDYQNPAVFRISDRRGLRILSMVTGDLLFEVPYGADGNYVNGVIDVDGLFRCMADGMPQRLVLKSEDGDRLITNAGEAVSDAYPRITPLIWKGASGIFLVETWDSVDEEIAKQQSFAGDSDYFERGRVLSAPVDKIGWRCGLMDQDGGIIVPIEHDSIQVTDDLHIILGGADGPTEILCR